MHALHFRHWRGCATVEVPLVATAQVPASRIFIVSEPVSDANATVIFVRDKGFVGSGLYLHLSINGAKAAALNPSERVEWRLKPGDYAFGVKFTDPFSASAVVTVAQEVKSGRTYVFRLVTDGTTLQPAFIRVIQPIPGE